MIKKLREYRKLTTTDNYLLNENRQNLSSLNQVISSVNQLNANAQDIFYLSLSGLDITNTTKMISISDATVKSGKIASNVFYPSNSGTFWVELEFKANVAVGYSSRIYPVDQLGAQIDEGVILSMSSGPIINCSTSRSFFANLNTSSGIGFKAVSGSSAHINSVSIKISKVG